MKLPPPRNPVAEGDAELEAAETEAADPREDDVQPHQSAPTRPKHSQPLGSAVWRTGWPLLSMMYLLFEQSFMSFEKTYLDSRSS